MRAMIREVEAGCCWDLASQMRGRVAWFGRVGGGALGEKARVGGLCLGLEGLCLGSGADWGFGEGGPHQ